MMTTFSITVKMYVSSSTMKNNTFKSIRAGNPSKRNMLIWVEFSSIKRSAELSLGDQIQNRKGKKNNNKIRKKKKKEEK